MTIPHIGAKVKGIDAGRGGHTARMPYFSYHAVAHRLLREGKLLRWTIVARHGEIAPALVLVFDDRRHPVMPIRAARFEEYLPLLPPEKYAPAP